MFFILIPNDRENLEIQPNQMMFMLQYKPAIAQLKERCKGDKKPERWVLSRLMKSDI